MDSETRFISPTEACSSKSYKMENINVWRKRQMSQKQVFSNFINIGKNINFYWLPLSTGPIVQGLEVWLQKKGTVSPHNFTFHIQISLKFVIQMCKEVTREHQQNFCSESQGDKSLILSTRQYEFTKIKLTDLVMEKDFPVS